MANQDDLIVARAALGGDKAAVNAVLGELPYSLAVLLSKCTDSDSEEKAREIIEDLPGDLLAGVDRDGKTVHVRHMYVHQHQVKRCVSQSFERFFAVFGQDRMMTTFFKQANRDLLIDAIIFGQ